MENIENKIAEFMIVLEAAQMKELTDSGMTCEANIRNRKVKAKFGRKYINVDVGTSGKYMVEKETGAIFGIKAYGMIHRGHCYGTLDTIDQWDWSEYTAFKKGSKTVIPVTGGQFVIYK